VYHENVLPTFNAKDFLTPAEVRIHNDLVVEIRRRERELVELHKALNVIRRRARTRKSRGARIAA
jgi:hypothetical protein